MSYPNSDFYETGGMYGEYPTQEDLLKRFEHNMSMQTVSSNSSRYQNPLTPQECFLAKNKKLLLIK